MKRMSERKYNIIQKLLFLVIVLLCLWAINISPATFGILCIVGVIICIKLALCGSYNSDIWSLADHVNENDSAGSDVDDEHKEDIE